MFFPSKCGELKRNPKIAKKKKKKKRKAKKKEVCHVLAKFRTKKFDCSGRVNWHCNKGYRQPPDVCGKEVADPMGMNNDRRMSVGNRPPTGHETTTERAGDRRRAEVSGENEHAFVFLACLLACFPRRFLHKLRHKSRLPSSSCGIHCFAQVSSAAAPINNTPHPSSFCFVT
jgi:hypothetical protein